MFKSLVAAAILATIGCTAYADEPMTLEAVSAAAKDGIDFVDNDYISTRQATNPNAAILHRTRVWMHWFRAPNKINWRCCACLPKIN